MSLPSMKAIQSFYNAARLESVAGGADALNVTPGAVRHQIRMLEAHIGAELVTRARSGFRLTPTGRAVYAKVADAFAILGEAFQTPLPGAAKGELRVACAPALMALRMGKVLHAFSELFPLVTIRMEPLDAGGSEADVVISFGDRNLPGTRRAMLKNEAYFPVGSPSLTYEAAPLQSVADLTQHVLLHADQGEDWRRVLLALGRAELVPRQEMFFPNAHLTVRAAREGCGIAIGSSILCADDLRHGTLVRLLDMEIPAPCPYFVITPNARDNEFTEAFVNLLLRELER